MPYKKHIITLFVILCALAGVIAFNEDANRFASRVLERISFFGFYQNMANPYVRYVRVPEGLRKEQVADLYSKVLAWNDQDVKEFLGPDKENNNLEGRYYPSTYLVSINANGSEVKEEMIEKFNDSVVETTKNKRYKIDKTKVNMDTILKVASLIQREAAGKHDMNLISGIIWNRIWNGMSLDIDATLQYAKGNEEDGWWPQVLSKDKKIDSPYNTYKNTGLPPTPISNPGLAAIEAAYNPQQTNCIFYFHDDNRVIHCSQTYAEHKKGVEAYLR